MYCCSPTRSHPGGHILMNATSRQPRLQKINAGEFHRAYVKELSVKRMSGLFLNPIAFRQPYPYRDHFQILTPLNKPLRSRHNLLKRLDSYAHEKQKGGKLRKAKFKTLFLKLRHSSSIFCFPSCSVTSRSPRPYGHYAHIVTPTKNKTWRISESPF